MSNPFPDLPPDEYDALLEDIERRGMVYPVIRDQDGQTIDGHQRERICVALGIEPHYRDVRVASDTEREALAIVLNTHRRHLTAAQRRDAILRLAPTGMTQVEIGAAVGVTQGRVAQVISANTEPRERLDSPATWQPGHDYSGAMRSEPRDDHWSSLDGLVKSLRGLSDSTPADVAASVPERRRQGTAKTLRKLGTYLGSIALELEDMSE